MSEQTAVKACGFSHNADVIGTIIMQAVRNNDIEMLNTLCKEMESLPDDIENFMIKEEKKLGDMANYIFAAGAAYTLLELADNLSQEARTIKMITSQQNETKDKIVKILFNNEPCSYQDFLKLSRYSKEDLDCILSEMTKDTVKLIQLDMISKYQILLLTKIGRQYVKEKWGLYNGEN